jgi:2-dehydro-3-deoxygluconokinase
MKIKMKRVACVGEAMIELSMMDGDAQINVAGDTLNTAIYLHRTAPQLTVDYITCLGSDTFSDSISAFIADQGVGNSKIKRIADGTPGLYAITTSQEGERSFTYWRSNSAARHLFSDGDFTILETYDAVYLSGISLAILPHAVRISLLEWLNKHSICLIFDSNYRPHLWESLESTQQITSAFWARADILLPSIDDEMKLFGETEEQVAFRFSCTAKFGALKRGVLGPLSLGIDVHGSYPPSLKVLDTTAAGDSFNGGYLGTILGGESQELALKIGHDLAAQVIQCRGAIIPKKGTVRLN